MIKYQKIILGVEQYSSILHIFILCHKHGIREYMTAAYLWGKLQGHTSMITFECLLRKYKHAIDTDTIPEFKLFLAIKYPEVKFS